jgi:glyoxylase-like metal-dependent hydrolase (beta-lactamase superfamily II)
VSVQFEDTGVRVQKLNLGPYDNCVYIVECLVTGSGIIIDAAAEPEVILAAASDVDVSRVLKTHGHADHLGALDPVIAALDIPWAMHPADVTIAGREPDERLKDGQEIPVGELLIHVLSTPGHTPGSVTFVLEPVAFTGDTLFPGGPGATRWDYSSFGQIMDSIEQRIIPLGDNTLVFPGHGSETTVGTERPDLEKWRARGW